VKKPALNMTIGCSVEHMKLKYYFTIINFSSVVILSWVAGQMTVVSN